MKLLINDDLAWAGKLVAETPAEYREAEIEAFRYMEDVARKFSLYGKFEIRGDILEVKIPAQKVTLDEVGMNELFADLLTELFAIEIKYAALGGAGCGFAFDLASAKPVFSEFVTAADGESASA